MLAESLPNSSPIDNLLYFSAMCITVHLFFGNLNSETLKFFIIVLGHGVLWGDAPAPPQTPLFKRGGPTGVGAPDEHGWWVWGALPHTAYVPIHGPLMNYKYGINGTSMAIKI